MKANEIRVGNIFIGYDDKPFIWGLKEFSFIEPDVAIDIDEIIKSPITLTEEILLKCGFTHEIGDYFHIGDHFFVLKLLKGKFLFDKFWHKEVAYLHQLQNLYFSLTGQELNTSELL